MAKKVPVKTSRAFEHLDIINTTVKVKNAGDGLSKSLEVDTPDLAHRDTVHVVLECEVVDIQTPLVKDTDSNSLCYVLKAGRATFVDGAMVAQVLDEMDRKLEESAGISRLFDEDGNPISTEDVPPE